MTVITAPDGTLDATGRLLLRDMHPSETEHAVAFHNAAWGDSRTADQWRWEWFGRPNLPSFYKVVVDGERWIATQGMLPIYLIIDGERALTAKNESLWLVPEHRGTGMAQRFYRSVLDEAARRGFQIVWGFTPAAPAFRTFGFHVSPVMARATLPLPSSPIRAALREWRAAPTNLEPVRRALADAYRRSAISRDPRGFTVEDGFRSPTDVEHLYARLRAHEPGLIHLALDAEYVQWRIEAHPFITYRQIAAYRGDELAGYLIFSRSSSPMAYIADLTFESDTAGELLAARALELARETGAAALSYLGNRANPVGVRVFKVLEDRFSFESEPHEGMLSVRYPTLPEGRTAAADPTRWHMNGLWTEGYSI